MAAQSAATEDEEIPKSTSTKNEFRCINCSDTFTQKWSLRRHENKCKTNNLRSHSCTNSREKGFKCHNFGCDYKGRRFHHLQTHQRSCRGRIPIPAAAETSDEIAVVAVVDRRSGETPDYLTEKASVNEGEPQFNCSICTFRCKSRSRLKTHLIAHTSQKPFRCPIEGCNFQTKWSYNVRIHCRALHHMESPPKTPLQTEDFGPVTECQTETEVDANNGWSSMAFACMLCDFVGDSELSALEHARQHTAVYVPLGPTH